MLVEITKTYVRQKCQCGSENLVGYDRIKYTSKLPQFVMPICENCKSRIQFIFLSTNMTKEEFQLMIKMKELGLMEK